MARKTIVALAIAGLALTGCDKEATGQVTAVVNGDEITLQEINAELGNTPVPEGADKKTVQNSALERIVNRRLLAQAAIEAGIDETPEFLLRERQLHDALLVQLLSQRAERSLKVPDQQAIDKFIADNPDMFAERTVFGVERIQFPLPADPEQLKTLEDDHSMNAVAKRLNQLGIQFKRDKAQMDSAQLGAERLKVIRGLPAGEPFVIPERGMVTVGVVVGERSAPIPPSEAGPLAVRIMRNRELTKTMKTRIDQAREQAEISYQTGFGDKKDEASAADTASDGPDAEVTADATAE